MEACGTEPLRIASLPPDTGAALALDSKLFLEAPLMLDLRGS